MRMLSTYPAAWLLLCLPFVSSVVIAASPPLRGLATRMNWMTRPVGMLGLALLFAGLTGLIPTPASVPLMILGGVVSGYTVFSTPRRSDGGGGDDWRRWTPPPDDPPAPPGASGPLDWELFDRLRADWERRPVPMP